MSRWRTLTQSLYARIAGVYLVLLLVLCLICAAMAVRYFNQFMLQLDQHMNRKVADTLAMQLEPALKAGPNMAAVQSTARRVQRINPSLELYVLDHQGRVIAGPRTLEALHQKRVALAPIRAFIQQTAELPLRNDDPETAGEREIFSAAPVTMDDGRQGYVYVILRGMSYQSAASMLRSSYIIRALVANLTLTLVFTGIIGLILFALLTRRFRALTATVERFKNGDHSQRAPNHRHDEIGRLGNAFNEMAATISAQVEALRRTDEERRTLVANLSHDLRTPLTSLRGYVERMLNKAQTLTPEEQKDHLEAVHGNAIRLGALVEQLSLLSHLDLPQAELNLEPLSIVELSQDVIVKFRPKAQANAVALALEGSRELPQVVADISLVERALSNLIDNAIDNTPVGGRVSLELHQIGAGVQVSIRDTGHGIASDELSLVRQRFYRTRRSRAAGASREGSGLGLAIANEIAERHGTALDVRSRVNQGTAISFVLPSYGDPNRTIAASIS